MALDELADFRSASTPPGALRDAVARVRRLAVGALAELGDSRVASPWHRVFADGKDAAPSPTSLFAVSGTAVVVTPQGVLVKAAGYNIYVSILSLSYQLVAS